MQTFGTATWNDEEYLLLEPASAGPNLPVTRGRDHLRHQITEAAFKALQAAMGVPDYPAIARSIQTMATGQPSDAWLTEIVRGLLESGITPWTICVYSDKNHNASTKYFVEVFKWR